MTTLTNPDDKTRRDASALRTRMIKTMRKIVEESRHSYSIEHVFGKKTRTKFGSVNSDRVFLVRDDDHEYIWVSNGALLLGPIWLKPEEVNRVRHCDKGPVFQHLRDVDEGATKDVRPVEILAYEKDGKVERTLYVFDDIKGLPPEPTAFSAMSAANYGINSVYLELALQWLDVGEGRNRKRKADPQGLTIRQAHADSPLVLHSTHTGRVAIICPARTS